MLSKLKKSLIPLYKYFRKLINVDLNIKLNHICELEKHGSDYGGWYIHPNISDKSTVYSLGIGEDISFDESLMSKYGVTVHAFDPTPESHKWLNKQKIPKNLVIHNYGISNYDGKAQLYALNYPTDISKTILKESKVDQSSIDIKVKRLVTVMKNLGHHRLDLLKMDIEGAEYVVIEDILKSGIDVRQLLIEYHHRFKGIGKRKTIESINLLKENGYRIFYVSKHNEEFCFMKFD